VSDLRILFLSIYNPFDIASGPSTHLLHLSQELAKLGCEVHVLTLENGIEGGSNGVQMHTSKLPIFTSVGRGLFFSFFTIKKIEELCKEYQIDIVHGQSPSSFGYACFRRKRLPFIVTLHSTSFGEISSFLKMYMPSTSLPEIYNSLVVQCLWATLTRFECGRADRVITVSKSLAKEAVNFYGISKDKVVAIHNGVNFLDDPPIERRNGRHVILYVGRLIQEKGLEYLIGAMPYVLSRFPEAKLQLVGDGNHRRRLKSLAQKLKVDGSVDFSGIVPSDMLYSLYARASVVVQPSIYESCGIPVLEAMSMGKPVVGARAGGIPELIKNGETGLLVEPRSSAQLGAAISTLLSNWSYSTKLGEKGRSVVTAHFTWKEVARKTLELYEEICEEN
jgi:glycosyltransferase involved in cell wall biosynthesis